MNRMILSLSALLLVAVCPARAQYPAPLPIVTKCYHTLQTTPALSVQVAQTGTFAEDNAVVRIDGPRRVVVISRRGQTVVSTLVDDGRTISEWNQTQYATQPAPKSLVGLAPMMPMGLAANIGGTLLTNPTIISDYPNLRDMGTVTLRGVRTHRVVSVDDGSTATFWLNSKTGLPVQASFTGGRHNRTLVFTNYVLGPAARRQAVPVRPRNLALYSPMSEPPLLKVGTSAPDFALPRASGNGVGQSTVSLSSLRGQIVLIDFWASWCGPCKHAMPHIQELKEKFGPKGLVVLSVNSWDMQNAMSKFLQTHPQYTSTFLFDASPGGNSVATGKYNVSGIPTVYLVDKDGHVAGTFVGDDPKVAAQINTALAQLIAP